MNLSIEVPDGLIAAVNARAASQGVEPSLFLRSIIEHAVEEPVVPALKPRRSGYGLLADLGPAPTEQEIDENRREMFAGFGEDAP